MTKACKAIERKWAKTLQQQTLQTLKTTIGGFG
jgi:hypothetical protein